MILHAVPSAWGWRKASGCWGGRSGLPFLPTPSCQSDHRAPFKSSRPSSGPGRDYSGLSRVDSSGTGADERNAPPRVPDCPPLSTGWNGRHLPPGLGALCDRVLHRLAEIPWLHGRWAAQPLLAPSLGFPTCVRGWNAGHVGGGDCGNVPEPGHPRSASHSLHWAFCSGNS